MLGSAYPVVLWVRAGADAFEGISKISGPRNGGEREIELELERARGERGEKEERELEAKSSPR